jgi:thiol-disulfide isomerase/thioredoxin
VDELEPKEFSPAFRMLVIALPVLAVLIAGYVLTHPESMMEFSSKEPLDISFRVPGEPVTRSLSQFRGRVIVATLWSAECGDCQSQIGALNELSKQYGRDGLLAVAITGETFQTMSNHVSLLQMPIMMGRMEKVQEEALPKERPYTYLIDREGLVRLKFGKVRDADKLSSTVEKLLGR